MVNHASLLGISFHNLHKNRRATERQCAWYSATRSSAGTEPSLVHVVGEYPGALASNVEKTF